MDRPRSAILFLTLTLLITVFTPTVAQRISVGIVGTDDAFALQETITGIITTSSRLNVQAAHYRTIEQLAPLIAAGTGPDVLVVPYLVARELYRTGAALTLDDVIQRDPVLSQRVAQIYPGILHVAEVDGRLIGLPRALQMDLMLYNPQHTEELGVEIQTDWTWSDFAVVAQRLRLRSAPLEGAFYISSGSGRFERMERRQEGAVLCPHAECWLPFVWSNGGEFLDPTRGRTQLNQPAAREAFEWMRSLVEQGWVALSPQPTSLQLTQGLASLAPGGSSLLALRGSPFGPTISVPQLRGVPYPKAPRTGAQVSPLQPELYLINPQSRNIQSAVEYVTLALSPSAQRQAFEYGLYPVVRDVDYPANATLVGPEALEILASQGQPYPPTYIGETIVWSVVTPQVQAFLDGRISLDSMLGTIDSEVMRLYLGAD